MTDSATRLAKGSPASVPQGTTRAGHFGPRLRLARKERGWTLKDLSAASGISITYLSDLERGKLQNPTLDTITSLAESMGMTMNALLGITDAEALREGLPPALQAFCESPAFAEAVAADSERLKVPAELIIAEWERLLAGVKIFDRVPSDVADYHFVFQAVKRVLA